jgi:hypothetical protein
VSFIGDLPLVLIGASLAFLGNIVLTKFDPDFFTVTIGGSLVIVGVSMSLVGLLEPFVRFLSKNENIVHCPFCEVRDFALHPEVHIEGVKLTDTDYKKIIEDIVKDESNVIGGSTSLSIARKVGIEVNDKGNLAKTPSTPLRTLETLINAYVSDFGRITFLPIELIMSNYPNIKLNPQVRSV